MKLRGLTLFKETEGRGGERWGEAGNTSRKIDNITSDENAPATCK